MKPVYDLDKIKFGTDAATFERAVKLYESGKVTKFSVGLGDFSATVLGTSPYRVNVSLRHYDHGNCNCYLGQNDELCKHMVAVAICAVMSGKKLSADDKKVTVEPICSGKSGELSTEELKEKKREITAALRYIKAYNGPSRTWFAYQNSLREGCARLSAIVSELPVSTSVAKLLIDLLLRLDKKLMSSGVDDSDGTVGNFMTDTVDVLSQFAKINPATKQTFAVLRGRSTCFDWERPLADLIEEGKEAVK